MKIDLRKIIVTLTLCMLFILIKARSVYAEESEHDYVTEYDGVSTYESVDGVKLYEIYACEDYAYVIGFKKNEKYYIENFAQKPTVSVVNSTRRLTGRRFGVSYTNINDFFSAAKTERSGTWYEGGYTALTQNNEEVLFCNFDLTIEDEVILAHGCDAECNFDYTVEKPSDEEKSDSDSDNKSILESILSLPSELAKALKDMLQELFIPSEQDLSTLKEKLDEKLPIASQLKTILDELMKLFQQDSAASIQLSEDYTLSLSFLDDHIQLIRSLTSAFLMLNFTKALIYTLPSFLHGSSQYLEKASEEKK